MNRGDVKQETGITLVALIITVIILVILAAVSIATVVNMGIVNTAYEGTANYADTARRENEMLNTVKGFIDSANGEVMSKLAGEGGSSGGGDNPGGGASLPEGAGTRVSAKTAYTVGTKTAQIPANFTISGNINESSITGGLVIYYIPSTGTNAIPDNRWSYINWTNLTYTKEDESVVNLKETYDQFVWIPVASANDMYICQNKGTDIDESGTVEDDEKGSCNIQLVNNVPTCTEHSNSTAMAGRLYATGTGANWAPTKSDQVYTANSGIREPDTVTHSSTSSTAGSNYDGSSSYIGSSGTIGTMLGTGYSSASDFRTMLQTEYNAEVKSVIENHGFWVGRYETSGMNSSTAGAIGVVAGTNTGINNVTWYKMYAHQKKYAENKGLIGGMISGAAFDQVLKFADANYDVTSGTEVSHSFDFPYNTGSQSGDIANNIYDLEGNVTEWTKEANNTNGRVFRGGDFCGRRSASHRYGYGPWNEDVNLGSRSTLYV